MKNKEKNIKINKKVVFFVFLIALIATFIVLGNDGPKKVINSLKQANPFWLVIAILIFLIFWAFDGIILMAIFKKKLGKKYPIKDLINLVIIGRLFDYLTPLSTGGQPFQVWKMHKQGITVSKSSSMLLFKFIAWQFGVMSMYSLIILLNLKSLSSARASFRIFIIMGYLMNLLLAILLAAAVFLPKTLNNQINNLIDFLVKLNMIKNAKKAKAKVAEEIDEFYASFRKISNDKILTAKVFVYTLIQIALWHCIAFFVFLSLGGSAKAFFASFSSSHYAYLLSSFIPLPGASIGAEGSFVLFFSNTYSKHAVGLAMIIWRAITYYLPILLGFLILIDYKHVKEKIAKLFKK